MIKYLLTLIPMFFLVACVTTESANYDSGGNVVGYAATIAYQDQFDIDYTVPKRCMSACTMYLALDTACFPIDGVLGFHGPTNPLNDSYSGPDFEITSQIMAKHYPDSIRDDYLNEWRYSGEFVMIPASFFIDNGEAKACED